MKGERFRPAERTQRCFDVYTTSSQRYGGFIDAMSINFSLEFKRYNKSKVRCVHTRGLYYMIKLNILQEK